jgi:4-amino-4-deoxy-L-arabinose transferase-like glycosyltransferase
MKKKKDKSYILFIIPSIILLLLALFLRFSCDKTFYNLETAQFAAKNLTEDNPFTSVVLWYYFKNFFKIYSIYHIIPVYLFLLPSVFLLSMSLSSMKLSLSFSEKEKYLPFILFIFSFFITLASHFFITGHLPPVGDEFCYVFQSDLMAQGKLYETSPPCSDSFHSWSIINDGKWYSKVTAGWPLLLAVGRFFHAEFIINPILSASSIVILYLTGKLLPGNEGAFISVSFALLSPLFFLLGGNYFPHNAVSFLALLFIYGIFKSFYEKTWTYPILSGISSLFLILIRPGDGLSICAGTVPLMIYLFIKSKEKKPFLLKLLSIGLLFFLGAALLLMINHIQNGSPFLFGYEKYDPDDKWGFTPSVHTPLHGLFNSAFSFMRNSFWTVPFVAFFTLLSFFGKELKIILLLVPVLFLGISYGGFYYNGAFEIGSRYYLPSFMLCLIPASSGFLYLKKCLEEKKFKGVHLLTHSLISTVIIFMIFGVFIQLFPSVKEQYRFRCEPAAFMSENLNIKSPSLIFLKGHGYFGNMFFTRNFSDYKSQKIITVLYLDPVQNENLIKSYPDRKVYTLEWEGREGKFIVKEGIDNEKTVKNYMASASNYIEFDWDKSIECCKSALSIEPDNTEVLHLLAMLYDAKKEFPLAIEIYKKLSKYPSLRDISLYQTGRDLGDMGKYEEAIVIFESLQTGDKALYMKAKNWIIYYRNR